MVIGLLFTNMLTVPLIHPLTSAIQRALTVQPGGSLLLSLPASDATGKINLGTWEDTRDDDIRLADHEGIIRIITGKLSTIVPDGVVPIKLGRWVQNLWPVADGSDAPTTQTITVISGSVYQLRIGSTSVSGATAVCSGAFTGTLTGDATNPQAFDTAKTSGSTSLTVTISGSITDIQLEDVTGQANQNPSEYQKVDAASSLYGFAYYTKANGNTVSGNIVTEAVGADLTPVPTMVHWPASTNECIHSRDFSSWTNAGTPTEVQDQVGIDGKPNMAWTLGDNEGASIEGKTLTVSVSNDSNNYILTVHIAKDTDETRFPEIQLVLIGGTQQQLYVQINTKTGAITDRSVVGSAVSSITSLNDFFWKVELQLANNSTGNTVIVSKLYPAVTTVWGSTGSSATGTMVVDWAQLELNKAFATPPILTAGAAVSRDVTGIQNLVAGHFNADGFTLRVKITPIAFAQADLSATEEGIVSVQDSAAGLLSMSSAGLSATDGTNTATVNPSFAADTEIEIIVSASAALNELQVGYYDGAWTWGTITAYTGTPPTGININLFYGLVRGGCAIGMFRVYNKHMTIAQREALV